MTNNPLRTDLDYMGVARRVMMPDEPQPEPFHLGLDVAKIIDSQKKEIINLPTFDCAIEPFRIVRDENGNPIRLEGNRLTLERIRQQIGAPPDSQLYYVPDGKGIGWK